MISARAAGRTTIVSPVTTRVELSQKVWEDIRGSSEWRFPCREPDEGRPSRPVRRAGISRPYYHYAFAMLLGSTLFVTFSRMWDSLSSWAPTPISFSSFFLKVTIRMKGSSLGLSFVLPSLNYLLNIEFARYKISTNWDHKADWANGKGGVSRSAIDYRQTFPELQPSLSIQDTNNYLYHNHWHMRATPPDSRSLHGKPPLGDEASRGFRGRYRHDTVVGKPVLSLSTRDINGAHPGLGKLNTRMERPPS
ncbi:unnamed protein product [Vicia faba]|uniref:Uncharacterized protein n=2 Tax=Vicia faba TaxID=3906 RepID=A0AAV1A6Y6_VICFA|nr:unnamed protein product [Vicia faba]CAI8606359.1 unnamed protein product [Vicia faba]